MPLRRALVVLTAIAALACATLWPVTRTDLAWLDLQWQLLQRTSGPPDERIVVVGIDEHSIAAAREPLALWHRQLAEFLQSLRDAAPALVALDIVLPDRSYGDIAPGLDEALIRAL